MVLKKDAKSKLELELLERSLDFDKFEYNGQLQGMFTLLAGIIALLATALSIGLMEIATALVMGLFIIPALFYFLSLQKIKARVKRKQEMVLERYAQLGLNIREMNLELTNSKGSHK